MKTLCLFYIVDKR